jgi:hypothetical protein
LLVFLVTSSLSAVARFDLNDGGSDLMASRNLKNCQIYAISSYSIICFRRS